MRLWCTAVDFLTDYTNADVVRAYLTPRRRMPEREAESSDRYWVYVLLSRKDGMLYTGYTSVLQQRIRDHHAGKVRSTKHRRPLVLIHAEAFHGKAAAMDRERFLKTPAAASIKSELLRRFLEGQSPHEE